MNGRVHAVVFDLDDTLMDTSGQLVGAANREAAEAMIAAGLPGTVEAVARRRSTLSRMHPGEDADVLTVRSFDLTSRTDIAAAGRHAYYSRRVRHVEPFPDTVPLLQSLRGSLDLCLMTTGSPPTQRRKIELLGIADYFDEIVVLDVETENKHDALVALRDRRAWDRSTVVIVGDRIDREIAAGRRLGMWTVRVDHGEGRYRTPNSAEEQAHYTIAGVGSLPKVLKEIVDSGISPLAVQPVGRDGVDDREEFSG